MFDSYRGVICYLRVFSGEISEGNEVLLMSKTQQAQVKEVGVFSPKMFRTGKLVAGQVGYIVTSIKLVTDVKTGDTITLGKDPAKDMLPGYKEVRPMVFSGIYPIDTSDYERLKSAMAKLQLNDSALVYQLENSIALGFGFLGGFLGLLHMEIVQERIRREYDLDVISTYPSVVYLVMRTDGVMMEVENPCIFRIRRP
jgi:GTP-binding protein LepA